MQKKLIWNQTHKMHIIQRKRSPKLGAMTHRIVAGVGSSHVSRHPGHRPATQLPRPISNLSLISRIIERRQMQINWLPFV